MEKGCISIGRRKGERGPRVNPMTARVRKYPTYTFVYHHYGHWVISGIAITCHHLLLLIFSTANYQFWSSFQRNKPKKLLNHKIHLMTSYTNGRSLWANSLCLNSGRSSKTSQCPCEKVICEANDQHVVINLTYVLGCHVIFGCKPTRGARM